MVKDNVHGIRLGDSVLGTDIKIVSTCVVDLENDELRFDKDGIDTPFEPSAIDYVYYIDDHEIDVPLAVQIGLGVIEDLVTGRRYLYNADMEWTSDTQGYELIRMGIYYQIKFPEYEDRKLDNLLNGNPIGEEFLRALVSSDYPIEKLKEIFKAQKGNGNNVIEFKKRG